MRRKKIWVVTLMAFMVFAMPALAQKGKKPKKGQIPVTVTFRDDPSDNIKSDGGPYNRATFIGAGKGNFHLRIVGKGKRPATRTLFLDFFECTSVPVSLCQRPLSLNPSGDSDPEGAVNIHTFGLDLRTMGIGESRSIELSVTLDLVEEGIWTVFFRPNADCAGSSNINVMRFNDTTYEITADTNDTACLGQSEGGAATIFKGLYQMPFKITLVCKDPTQCVAPSP